MYALNCFWIIRNWKGKERKESAKERKKEMKKGREGIRTIVDSIHFILLDVLGSLRTQPSSQDLQPREGGGAVEGGRDERGGEETNQKRAPAATATQAKEFA